METIRNKTSVTIGDVFKRYITRKQLKTGKKCNTIAVDQGTEFDGDFLKLTKELGMTKLKAPAYRHHLPPKTERATQTLLKFGRTLLLALQLPASFYAEAQQMACYLLNRLVHSGETKSPYEIMYCVHSGLYATYLYLLNVGPSWLMSGKRLDKSVLVMMRAPKRSEATRLKQKLN